MTRTARFARQGFLYAALLLFPATVNAATNLPQPDSAFIETCIVMLVFSDVSDESVEQAIRAGLSDIRVVFDVTRRPAALEDEAERWSVARSIVQTRAVSFVFWIENGETPLIRFLIPKSNGEVLETRQLSDTGSAGASETAAVLVRRTVLSLQAESAFGTAQAEARNESRPLEKPSVPVVRIRIVPRDTPRAEPHRLLAAAVFRNTIQSSAHPSLIGAQFLVGLGLKCGLQPFAAYSFQVSSLDVAEGVRLTLHRHPMELGARYLFPVPRGRMRLAFSAAADIDILTRTVEVTAESFDTVKGGNPVEVSLVTGFEGALCIVGPVYFIVRIGIKILLQEARFIMDTEEGSVVLHDSWPVQPEISAGLLFQLF